MKYNERKKVWVFYLIGMDNFFDTDKGEIYAYTDKKEYAKSFRDTRDMTKFREKKFSLSRSEYNELVHEYMRSDLEIFDGRTRSSEYMIKDFGIVLTMKESISIKTIREIYARENLFNYAWTDISFLKDKYAQALKKLQYCAFNGYIITGNDDIYNHIVETVIPDDFKILMDNIGSTLIKSEVLDE